MMRLKLLALFVILLFFASHVFASEEEFLEWQSAVLTSHEIKGLGNVIFEIETDGPNFRSLIVRAFDKEFSLDQSDLARLSGFPISSIRTTHEVGYEEVGGHTIYLYFERDSILEDGKPRAEKICVSINSSGVLVTGPTRI